MESAYTLWGFLGAAPADLVAFRGPLFRGAAHDYWRPARHRRPGRPEALPLTPAAVRGRLSDWRSLLAV